MDERADRGEFYPGGREGGVPPGTDTDKVDRVNLGELGEIYTLKEVKAKVNQIVRAIAPVAVCIAIAVVRLMSYAATAPLEDITNTGHVVTNEEDAVAMAAVGALGAAVSNRVEAAEGALQAEIAGATNAVVQAALRAAEAESNRVESTYAKKSEIPPTPDLAPYALKSELPQDYLVESDITNFATRAWINSQNYAREGTVYTRLDAQDLAIDAATNWLWAAHLAEAARLNAASNALAQAHAQDTGALSNRLEQARSALDSAWRAGTNTVMQTARSADEALQREIDALRIVAADSNAVTRLVTPDGTTYQDATGTVWQVQDSLGPWQATTSSVQFVSWEDLSTEEYDLWKIHFSVDGTNAEGYAASPAGLTSYTLPAGEWGYESGDPGEFDVSFVRPTIPGGATNAVNRVAYTNDLETIVPGNYETVSNRAMTANNYTDEVAADIRQNYIPISGDVVTDVELFLNRELHEQGQLRLELPNGSSADAKSFVSSSQITNQGAVAVATALAARKQDALPYPTNAIPYAAIDGAPSGGGTPEWREEWGSVSMGDAVIFVTNGIFVLSFDGAEATDTVMAYTGGWPDGAAMFVRGSAVSGPYQIANNIRLVGYGTWPTNNFQSVWWRSGTNIFVNILLEE